ncbi:MAG: hypothetical protein LBJ19_01695 [Holosporaceae bacterium]|jgi:hypothetical protein|nr:hypothetical protein [Holosporaceae bacterium]
MAMQKNYGVLMTMRNILFVIAICLFFVFVKFWRNIIAYLCGIPKLCYDNTQSGCCCSAMCRKAPESNSADGDNREDEICSRMSDFVSSNTDTKKMRFVEEHGKKERRNILQPIMVFGGTGYYFASNDVDEMLQCCPTPLQDTNPDDFA